MEKIIRHVPRITLLGFAAALLFLFAPPHIEAASFYFSPSKGSFYKNSNFKVSVMVESDQPVNAMKGFVNFPSKNLEIISIERDSIIDFWVQKPSFSNAGESGNVYFEGVTLNPGYVGEKGKVLDMVFRVKNTGAAHLYFGDFSILANDGKGTNISMLGGTAEFNLVPEANKSPAVQPGSVEDKIRLVEERMNSLSGPSGQGAGFLFRWWDAWPKWIQMGAILLAVVAAFGLALIFLSFSIVVSAWILSYIWRRRESLLYFARQLPRRLKRSIRRMLFWSRRFEEGAVEDMRYAAKQFRSDMRVAKSGVSFSTLIKDYYLSLERIARKIFVWK